MVEYKTGKQDYEKALAYSDSYDSLKGNMGLSYEVLNKYIRNERVPEEELKAKIDRLHRQSRFKFDTMPGFPVDLPLIDLS